MRLPGNLVSAQLYAQILENEQVCGSIKTISDRHDSNQSRVTVKYFNSSKNLEEWHHVYVRGKTINKPMQRTYFLAGSIYRIVSTGVTLRFISLAINWLTPIQNTLISSTINEEKILVRIRCRHTSRMWTRVIFPEFKATELFLEFKSLWLSGWAWQRDMLARFFRIKRHTEKRAGYNGCSGTLRPSLPQLN